MANPYGYIDGKHYPPPGLTADDIADGSIGTDQLADNAVTNAKMADNAVDTAELVNDAVTPAKLDETGEYTVAWITATNMDYIHITFYGYNDYAVTTSAGDIFDVDLFTGETVVTSANNGITFNSGNGRFTIASAGTYFYKCSVSVDRVSGGNQLKLSMSENSSQRDIKAISNDGAGLLELEGLITCAASDYLEFFIQAEANSEWEMVVGHSVYIHRLLGT